MISSKWGHFLDRPLAPLARKIAIAPNTLTVAGFIITSVAALVIPFNIVIGGFLILMGGMFDVLDGLVARVHKRVSDFGAFLDSILDRFSDALILSAIGLYLYREGDILGAVVSICALFGAYGVSYARARAEGMGYECRIGMLERPERIVLLAVGCILSKTLVIMVWIVLVGSYITVVQRITHVRKLMSSDQV